MLAKHSVRSKVDFDADIRSLLDKLGGWNIPDDALDRVHDSVSRELERSKGLTEYEDGKYRDL